MFSHATVRPNLKALRELIWNLSSSNSLNAKIYSANQLTGFYMMGAMAFKVLRYALNEGNTLFQY